MEYSNSLLLPLLNLQYVSENEGEKRKWKCVFMVKSRIITICNHQITHTQVLMTTPWHSLPHHPTIKPTLFHSLSTLAQHALAWDQSMIVPTSLFWDCVDGTLPAGTLAEAHKMWLWINKKKYSNKQVCQQLHHACPSASISHCHPSLWLWMVHIRCSPACDSALDQCKYSTTSQHL